jgi:hypothetical protein
VAAGLWGRVLVAIVRRGDWGMGLGRGAAAQVRRAVIPFHGCEVAVLDLRPYRSSGLSVAAQGAVIMVIAALTDVIAAVLDGGGVEEAVDLAAVGLLVRPGLDGAEHGAVDLDRLVPESWVVEDAEDVVHHLLNWHPWVLPSI